MCSAVLKREIFLIYSEITTHHMKKIPHVLDPSLFMVVIKLKLGKNLETHFVVIIFMIVQNEKEHYEIWKWYKSNASAMATKLRIHQKLNFCELHESFQHKIMWTSFYSVRIIWCDVFGFHIRVMNFSASGVRLIFIKFYFLSYYELIPVVWMLYLCFCWDPHSA